MKSPWMWMIVLVALGSGLITAEPQVDIQKLGGDWYPLARARTHLLANPVVEYSILPNTQENFNIILPVDLHTCGNEEVTLRSIHVDSQGTTKKNNSDSTGRCRRKSYFVSAEEGGFKISGRKNKIRIVDTDHKNYHIIAVGNGPKPGLILYDPCQL